MTEAAGTADNEDGVAAAAATPSSSSPSLLAPRPLWRHPVVLTVLGFLLVISLMRLFVAETFYVPSASMEPTLHAGQRIVIVKPGAHDVKRGDIVVFNGTRIFGPDRDSTEPTGVSKVIHHVGVAFGFRPGEADYVKRAIGIGGDRVSMTDSGVVSVNGKPLDEPYARIDSPGSAFDIQVPQGRIFVLGDNRASSDDSRAHLGGPGGGTIEVDDVIGKVVWRYWPLSQVGGVG